MGYYGFQGRLFCLGTYVRLYLMWNLYTVFSMLREVSQHLPLI